jgi:hypothetical protein
MPFYEVEDSLMVNKKRSVLFVHHADLQYWRALQGEEIREAFWLPEQHSTQSFVLWLIYKG